MPRDRRPSEQTFNVLLALAEDPTQWRHGYDLCQQTGLKAGSMYPILIRLADRGWLETSWEAELQDGPTRWEFALGCAWVAVFPPGTGGPGHTMRSTTIAAALVSTVLVAPLLYLQVKNGYSGLSLPAFCRFVARAGGLRIRGRTLDPRHTRPRECARVSRRSQCARRFPRTCSTLLEGHRQ